LDDEASFGWRRFFIVFLEGTFKWFFHGGISIKITKSHKNSNRKFLKNKQLSPNNSAAKRANKCFSNIKKTSLN
jgi:hypothetical protein